MAGVGRLGQGQGGRSVASEQTSTEDVTEEGRVILERETPKRGDQGEPFSENCWKK